MGVLHSFSIKNIFYDKMDLRLYYFMWQFVKKLRGAYITINQSAINLVKWKINNILFQGFYEDESCLQQNTVEMKGWIITWSKNCRYHELFFLKKNPSYLLFKFEPLKEPIVLSFSETRSWIYTKLALSLISYFCLLVIFCF